MALASSLANRPSAPESCTGRPPASLKPAGMEVGDPDYGFSRAPGERRRRESGAAGYSTARNSRRSGCWRWPTSWAPHCIFLTRSPTSDAFHLALFPERWRPVLVRQLRTRGSSSGRMPPRSSSPTTESVRMRHIWSHGNASLLRPGRETQLSRSLVRRVSPTLRIHDLGRTPTKCPASSTSPPPLDAKPSPLPLYLVTRPKQTAAREQVMEALWPRPVSISGCQQPASDSALRPPQHRSLAGIRRDSRLCPARLRVGLFGPGVGTGGQHRLHAAGRRGSQVGRSSRRGTQHHSPLHRPLRA